MWFLFVHLSLAPQKSRYLNGAYYDPSDDVYYPCQWSISGEYGTRKSALDLVNHRVTDTPF